MLDSFDPDQVSAPKGYFVSGRLTKASGEQIAVLRPSDGLEYACLTSCTLEEVNATVDDAWRAFRQSDWATCAPRQRALILRRWADLLEAEAEPIARLEALGSTRPIRDALAYDVPYTADCIRFFAELADKVGGDVAPTNSNSLGLIVPEPFGVIAAIAPWNFPLILAAWKFAPALAAGNAVVLKPSELTPFSILRLAELAIKAGMPAGIFNIVQGSGLVVGDALCRHPRIAKVTFTGSTKTGSAIMRSIAESGVKPVTLELGGKSPHIVFGDISDLDRTAMSISRGITSNAGQVCVAGSRLIVQSRIADVLVDRIVKSFGSLVPGPTWRSTTSLAPLISTRQVERVDLIVRQSVSAGATLLTGGSRPGAPQNGAFYLPTVLGDVTSEMPAVREEIFGPVLTVQQFDEEDEAVELAGDTNYGLAAAVHTSNIDRAMRMMRRVDAGTIWINRYGRSMDYILPTGGFKGSGFGKDLGRAAYESCLRLKTALIDIA